MRDGWDRWEPRLLPREGEPGLGSSMKAGDTPRVTDSSSTCLNLGFLKCRQQARTGQPQSTQRPAKRIPRVGPPPGFSQSRLACPSGAVTGLESGDQRAGPGAMVTWGAREKLDGQR